MKSTTGRGIESGDQSPDKAAPEYGTYRAGKRNERKVARAAKRAAKPKGIDLPFRKAMPRGVLIAFVVVALATAAVVVVVMVNPPAPRIAIAERRSPPGPSLSHNVGAIILAPIPETLPATAVPCDAFRGIVIEGGPPAQARLGGVLERLCSFAADDSDAARSLRALSKARLRFAVFARTGDTSTMSNADPLRILINVRFAQRDVSAALIGPLLAHEGFHLLHAGEAVTAEREYEARMVELQICRLLIDVDAWPRGCNDADQLIRFGRGKAVDQLANAGFPRRGA